MARQITKPGLSPTQHAEIDHTGIPGAGGEETFTQEVHDLEDHSSVPGVPSIEGLLDETAHDALDHTGLTGIPAAEAFTEVVHAETSHDGIAGDKQWKAPVDDEASLPINSEELQISNTSLEGAIEYLTTPYLSATTNRNAIKFPGQGTADYKVTIRGGFFTAPSGSNTLRGMLYTSVDEEPGVLVATAIEDVETVSTSGHNTYDFYFNAVALEEETDYFFVIYSISGSNAFRMGVVNTTENSILYTSDSGSTWGTHSKTSYFRLYTTSINTYDGDARYAKSEKTLNIFDGTDWNQVGDTTGLLDETAHDALDHSGLTGVGDKQWKAPVTYGSLPTEGMTDGDVCIERDSNKIYIFDGDADTPCWRESNREATYEGLTVDASSWREFIISLTDRSMLNIPNFECLITKIEVTAIDGNATPDMDYDIELFVDSEKSGYAYWAQNVTETNYEDKIPFIYEGGSTVFGRIVNNKAAAITDLDITIKFRV